MKIALTYGPMCLTFRGTLEFAGHRADPRGLTGSELAFIRIAEELRDLGHDIYAYTRGAETELQGIKIRQIDNVAEVDESFGACIGINEPEVLRKTRAKLQVCEQFLNSFDYCNGGFAEHVDLWISPSESHRSMILSMPHKLLGGVGEYVAEPDKWVAIPLGCDPERYDGHGDKVPGRVVYCSSPDRGLHLVLQEWPRIKKAVPHATLKIFYRLQAWIDGFKATGYFAPIEGLRARANYIEEALRRLSGPEWGITVCDSVSREQIEREMALAEVLAYPVDTIRWSEGFSCTILEACAARACPVLLDCDAIGSIYGDSCQVLERGEVALWRGAVIAALTNSDFRDSTNKRARALAEKLTWKNHVRLLVDELTSRRRSSTRAARS